MIVKDSQIKSLAVFFYAQSEVRFLDYTKTIKLDFNLSDESTECVVVKQNDALTRIINVELYNDGIRYIPEEDTEFSFRSESVNRGGVTVVNVDGTLVITLDGGFTSECGKYPCDIQLTKGDSVISTETFIIDVRPSPIIWR